ncbi:MAG: LuxR C-terminal-related transcriptional regulator [Nocardioides sp.]|jgi:DNA-binding CsgD family transcriptional regulator
MHEQGDPVADRDHAVARLDAACALVREGAIGEALSILGLLGDPSVAHLLGSAERSLLSFALVESRLARGDLAGAMALGHGLAAFLDKPGLTSAIAHYASGELASALGDPELALEHFLAVGEETADDPVSPELLPWRAGAALALLRRGNGRGAAELAVRHHEEALGNGSPYAIAVALRIMAATVTGDLRVSLLREARATLDGVLADRLLAQIDTDLAGALVLTHGGDTSEALAMLRGAEAYAGRQELWPLQGRVRRLLDHLGEAPQQIDSEAMASLTAAERRVAALAVEGLSNRQIAEQLLVSVKAIEWHLSNVYRKLEIRSRKALAPSVGAPA